AWMNSTFPGVCSSLFVPSPIRVTSRWPRLIVRAITDGLLPDSVDLDVTIATVAAGLVLSSPVLANGHPIPARYTSSGSAVSPPLRWSPPPPGTTSFSLRMIDLDTQPRFRHWTLTGIPASARSLAAGTAVGQAVRNTFGQTGYGGPCPPPGQKHRYLFLLDAFGTGGKRARAATPAGTHPKRRE